MICTWNKTKKGYKTGCEHEITVRLRGGVYCPFCGGLIHKVRTDYNRNYIKANESHIKQIRVEYYREHSDELKEYQKAYYRAK